MALTTRLARPQRWDRPFDPGMTAADLEQLKLDPVVAAIDADAFPGTIPLDGILANDSRVIHYKAGEIVVREGDYGNSAFLIMSGACDVVVNPPLTDAQLGRQTEAPASIGRAISQLWKRTVVPEVRDVSRYGNIAVTETDHQAVFLQDYGVVLGGRSLPRLGAQQMFGELAALGRTPRAASVVCVEDAEVLEIRWQGLRELRRFDAGWRRQIDTNYRANALISHLQDTPLFDGLPDEALQSIADQHCLRPMAPLIGVHRSSVPIVMRAWAQNP